MIKALFQPYFGKNRKDGEDFLGYPHYWVGDRFAQPLRNLKAAGAGRGIRMESTNYTDSIEADIYFFWERPAPDEPVYVRAIASGKPMILLATEPEAMVPYNYDPGNARIFDKIFTWRESLIDNKKYFPIKPINFAFPAELDDTPFGERKFCVLISSVYKSDLPGELYSERMVTIKWFEQHHPEEIDWYGRNNRYSTIDSPLYRGDTAKKQEVMGGYKFCICYESTSAIPSFITEKIFDAFFAGTIPVYWGPENIYDYVPKECFIDRRAFKSHEELYEFMRSITPADYARYIASIKEFLKGDFARSYGEWTLAEAIIPVCFGE